MPVSRRGAGGLSSLSASRLVVMERLPLPRLALASRGDAAPLSSLSVFRSPQAAQRPDQREEAAPQLWQTYSRCALAMGTSFSLNVLAIPGACVNAVMALTKACQHLIRN